jgi:hypothetical protein
MKIKMIAKYCQISGKYFVNSSFNFIIKITNKLDTSQMVVFNLCYWEKQKRPSKDGLIEK